ncbi:peptidase dimerization domain-containing protein, partial [Arthrobacter deserti]|nr:peptidase dimerization domain-containing protein [Arthrobacter deserti]
EKWNADRGRHRYFEDLEHPINFNFGGIAGGAWPSSVPAWCEFVVRAALYPGTTAEQAWTELQECLAGLGTGSAPITAVAVKTGFFSEGYVLEPGSEAEALLERTHEQVFGTRLESFTTPGY